MMIHDDILYGTYMILGIGRNGIQVELGTFHLKKHLVANVNKFLYIFAGIERNINGSKLRRSS